MFPHEWLPERTPRPVAACFADGRYALAPGVGTFYPHEASRLGRSAQAKAEDVLRCQQFSHTACNRPTDFWLRQVGYIPSPTCWGWGENLYYGNGSLATARAAMSGWLGSPGHRANILKPRFYQTGVGMTRGSLGGLTNVQVWVQHLAYRSC
jgi:uncharacterized protein YkwD